MRLVLDFWLTLLIILIFLILLILDFDIEHITKWEIVRLLFLIIIIVLGGIQ